MSAKKSTLTADQVRDISVAVYKIRLEDAVARMIEKDKDGGEKLRGRAASYDGMTRAYLEVLGK